MEATHPVYDVIGRYTEGRKTVAYQIKDKSTGVESKCTREDFIAMCQNRLVYGVVTTSLVNPDDVLDPTVILRGKAVCLAALPIYDTKTGKPKQIGKVEAAHRKVPDEYEASYKLVARLSNIRTTVGFEVLDLRTKETRRYRKEAIIKLIQAHQIANVRMQHYKGETLIRGTRSSLTSLPTIQVDSQGREIRPSNPVITPQLSTQNSDQPKSKPNTQKSSITAKLVCGRRTVGYVLHLNNNERRVSKPEALGLIKSGQISNARVQLDKSGILVRGVNCNFNKLPRIEVSENLEDRDGSLDVELQVSQDSLPDELIILD